MPSKYREQRQRRVNFERLRGLHPHTTPQVNLFAALPAAVREFYETRVPQLQTTPFFDGFASAPRPHTQRVGPDLYADLPRGGSSVSSFYASRLRTTRSSFTEIWDLANELDEEVDFLHRSTRRR